MLTIAKLGVGQENYYLAKVARGVEDYYSGEGEAVGEWIGRGAERLGLDGEVDSNELRSLLAGMAPGGEHRLAGREGCRRVPGWDLTFSAPKSVSVLWALGEHDTAREVVAAHEAAVRAGVEYLERYATVSRRRIAGRIEQVSTQGLVIAAFRHRTSRAGDPQLHTHALAVNAVERVDGGWGAVHSPVIYQHARTAGFVYQALLRSELTERLGVGWTNVVNGCAEIDGIDPELTAVFSKRRADIVDAMTLLGEHSARAAQVVAHRTRTTKRMTADVGELRSRWAAEAHDAGFTATKLLRHARAAAMSTPEVDERAITDELTAPTGLTMSRSTFERRDVMRAWCESIPGGTLIDLHELEAKCDRFVDQPDVIVIAERPAPVVFKDDGTPLALRPPERLWTTTEMLEIEQHLLDIAQSGQGVGVGTVDADLVEGELTRRTDLADEQAAMVRHLTTSGNGVDVVVGQAGTGKTYALAVVADLWRAEGLRPLGVALAARAAAELQAGAGIPSCTAAQFLLYEASQLTSRDVVVVDEAAMLDTRRLDRLLTRVADSGAKAVLVGDHHQLPAVEAGGAFAALVDRLEVVELRENRRQIHGWERDTLSRLRIAAGEPRGAAAIVASYRRHDRLHEVASTGEAHDAMVRDWHDARRSGQRVVMVASRREDVTELNRLARAALLADGTVEPDGVIVGGRQFAVGDQVVCLRNDRRLGVHNGLFGDVIHIEHANSTLTIDADGEQFLLPATYLEAGRLDHAYATTVHKAQGVTVDRTLVLGGEELYQQAVYVGLSRGRDRNDLYIAQEPDIDLEQHGTPDPAEPTDWLAAALSRDGSKSLAIVQGYSTSDDPQREAMTNLRSELAALTALEVEAGLSPEQARRRADLVSETMRQNLSEVQPDLPAEPGPPPAPPSFDLL